MKITLGYMLVFGTIAFGSIIGSYFLKREKKSNYYSKYYWVKVKELSDHQGWYYEIYKGNSILIKQENIPGTSGKQFFVSNTDAKKIALLVVNKLERKILPYISLADLDSCNIDFKK
ncbi:DUF4907 domain-containing protein [Aquimarina sp. 2304DJ70-9]|uniref:DUF4907 domain-containing protein n=1 Tax=Aquimarina penaris TaxID=3231044 RepID=UPI0034633646